MLSQLTSILGLSPATAKSSSSPPNVSEEDFSEVFAQISALSDDDHGVSSEPDLAEQGNGEVEDTVHGQDDPDQGLGQNDDGATEFEADTDILNEQEPPVHHQARDDAQPGLAKVSDRETDRSLAAPLLSAKIATTLVGLSNSTIKPTPGKDNHSLADLPGKVPLNAIPSPQATLSKASDQVLAPNEVVEKRLEKGNSSQAGSQDILIDSKKKLINTIEKNEVSNQQFNDVRTGVSVANLKEHEVGTLQRPRSQITPQGHLPLDLAAESSLTKESGRGLHPIPSPAAQVEIYQNTKKISNAIAKNENGSLADGKQPEYTSAGVSGQQDNPTKVGQDLPRNSKGPAGVLPVFQAHTLELPEATTKRQAPGIEPGTQNHEITGSPEKFAMPALNSGIGNKYPSAAAAIPTSDDTSNPLVGFALDKAQNATRFAEAAPVILPRPVPENKQAEVQLIPISRPSDVQKPFGQPVSIEKIEKPVETIKPALSAVPKPEIFFKSVAASPAVDSGEERLARGTNLWDLAKPEQQKPKIVSAVQGNASQGAPVPLQAGSPMRTSALFGNAQVTSSTLADSFEETATADGTNIGPSSEMRGTWSPVQATNLPAMARVDPALILKQVADGMARIKEGGVEIRLSPEELGPVRMQLVTGEQGLSVHIQADRPETLDLLRKHIDQLARDLASIGYEDASFSFGDDRHRADRHDQIGSDATEESEAIDAATTAQSLAAERGGLDIRV